MCPFRDIQHMCKCRCVLSFFPPTTSSSLLFRLFSLYCIHVTRCIGGSLISTQIVQPCVVSYYVDNMIFYAAGLLWMAVRSRSSYSFAVTNNAAMNNLRYYLCKHVKWDRKYKILVDNTKQSLQVFTNFCSY